MTDTDRRDLIELINNLHHAFAGDALATLNDPLRAMLPCRLLAEAGNLLAQTYSSDALAQLDEDALEGIVLSLRQVFRVLEASLQQVATALPASTPAALRDKAREAESRLLAAEDELLARKRELDELTQRRDKLLDAKRALKQGSLARLRAEVSQLDAELGPAQAELESLRTCLADRQTALSDLNAAVNTARSKLDSLDLRERETLDRLVSLGNKLREPQWDRYSKSVAEALDGIGEKTQEGAQLKQELAYKIAEVDQVFIAAAELEATLRLYADANVNVARDIPNLTNGVREKLDGIKRQLAEADNDLKRALEQHQKAGGILQKINF